MEANKVVLDLSTYNRLLLAETRNELIKNTLFYKDAVIVDCSGDLFFAPNKEVIKLLYPVEYAMKEKELLGGKADV